MLRRKMTSNRRYQKRRAHINANLFGCAFLVANFEILPHTNSAGWKCAQDTHIVSRKIPELGSWRMFCRVLWSILSNIRSSLTSVCSLLCLRLNHVVFFFSIFFLPFVCCFFLFTNISNAELWGAFSTFLYYILDARCCSMCCSRCFVYLQTWDPFPLWFPMSFFPPLFFEYCEFAALCCFSSNAVCYLNRRAFCYCCNSVPCVPYNQNVCESIVFVSHQSAYLLVRAYWAMLLALLHSSIWLWKSKSNWISVAQQPPKVLEVYTRILCVNSSSAGKFLW